MSSWEQKWKEEEKEEEIKGYLAEPHPKDGTMTKVHKVGNRVDSSRTITFKNNEITELKEYYPENYGYQTTRPYKNSKPHGTTVTDGDGGETWYDDSHYNGHYVGSGFLGVINFHALSLTGSVLRCGSNAAGKTLEIAGNMISRLGQKLKQGEK